MGSWDDTFIHRVMVRRITGRSTSNQPTYGDLISVDDELGVPCRVEIASIRQRAAGGDAVDILDQLITSHIIDETDFRHGGWKEVGIWFPGEDHTDNTLANHAMFVEITEDLEGADPIVCVTI